MMVRIAAVIACALALALPGTSRAAFYYNFDGAAGEVIGSKVATVKFYMTGSAYLDISDPNDVSFDGTFAIHSFVDANTLTPPLGTFQLDLTGTVSATHGVLSGTDLLWTSSTDSRVVQSGVLVATGQICAQLAPACTGDGIPFSLDAATLASGAIPVPEPQSFGSWSFTPDLHHLNASPEIALATYGAGNPVGKPVGSPQTAITFEATLPEPGASGLLSLLLALGGALALTQRRESRASFTNTSRASRASTSRPKGT